jgi:hypothetical protein
VHWEHEDKPILAGEGDWDALGVGTPAAVLEKGSITTWFTGINVKAEPSIGRAVCKI